MPDKDNFGAVLQPVGYRWQNDRDGLVQDGTAPACRASAGSSGFHEMNHPVVVQPFTKSKRAQSVTDDKTWVDGQVNPTLSLFDQGDTRATTVAVAFPINTLTLGGRTDAVNDKRMTMGVGENGDPQFTLQAAHGHAVAFTPGNLARGAGPSPNAEVAPTQRCSAGRGADDQRTCVAFAQNQVGEVRVSDVTGTINTNSNASGRNTPMAAVAFHPTQDPISSSGSTHALGTGSKSGCATAAVAQAMTVRRLLPIECERLQAFPDNWTLIPWRGKPAEQCPDGPRYKALGNSMAVNCMAWIGARIAAVENHNAN